MSLLNQRTTDTVQGAVALSRTAISEPGMTRFRLSICPRMRQPESLRSLTCQIWGIASNGPATETDIGLALPLVGEIGEGVGPSRDQMVFSVPGAAADGIPSFSFCPFLRNSSTMEGNPTMA